MGAGESNQEKRLGGRHMSKLVWCTQFFISMKIHVPTMNNDFENYFFRAFFTNEYVLKEYKKHTNLVNFMFIGMFTVI